MGPRDRRPSGKGQVKHQPQWIEAIHEALCNKRSNIQLGIDVRFQYNCPVIRSRQAVDLFAQAWIAMWPLAEFVLDERPRALAVLKGEARLTDN
ncbi:MAG: hypothetical protein AMK72_02205 [Planctomycetes bacterium SM23_25]|nr:MAG: hypothetical protein AMK72_02205 [Planctomycetes bacterium SM23_25]